MVWKGRHMAEGLGIVFLCWANLVIQMQKGMRRNVNVGGIQKERQYFYLCWMTHFLWTQPSTTLLSSDYLGWQLFLLQQRCLNSQVTSASSNQAGLPRTENLKNCQKDEDVFSLARQIFILCVGEDYSIFFLVHWVWKALSGYIFSKSFWL